MYVQDNARLDPNNYQPVLQQGSSINSVDPPRVRNNFLAQQMENMNDINEDQLHD